jgi:hypothetical protein
MRHGDAFSLFTLLFVLNPVMQILKSMTVTVCNNYVFKLFEAQKQRSPQLQKTWSTAPYQWMLVT